MITVSTVAVERTWRFSARFGEVAKRPFFDRMWYGPLLALPWQERRNLLQDIQKGRVVTDPRHRDVAFQYASTRLRRLRWAALAAAAIFVADVCLAVADWSSHSLGPALSSLSMVMVGFAFVTGWRQNRRFLSRNRDWTAVVGTERRDS